ncbi:VOC family protein [Haliangium sp.]|uniref:VOC family protein n=1 Tax=Haliangium sp. TaxID=2663208 RepID=UPI003D0DD6F9
MPTPRMLFLNLPVRDLDASKTFFGALGFDFDPRFTDDKAACMILDEGSAYAMLLTEPFFDTFTPRRRCDTKTECEGLFALSCVDRGEVDALADKAVVAGGTSAGDPTDHGFMYSKSFHDLDGHQWSLIWMDVDAVFQGD